ncbi:hypothetical protein IAT40_002916 [Kwoniella sp. CBS 6097]
MPKHVPTFKHLLHTSQTPRAEPHAREKSVNELLSSSRQSKLRDTPPHIASDAASGERVWNPSSSAGSSSSANAGIGLGAGARGLLDVEDGGVHPAELLRRMNLSNWRAARSVAGPAPPLSWRPSSSTDSNGHTARSDPNPSSISTWDKAVSSTQLASSSKLFTSGPVDSSAGSSRSRTARHAMRASLVDFCFRVVLKHLEDETVVYSPEVADNAESESGQQECETFDFGTGISVQVVSESSKAMTETYTMGRLLREQVPYLTTPLKGALLRQASLLPSSNSSRLSDRSILAILSDPPPDLEDGAIDPFLTGQEDPSSNGGGGRAVETCRRNSNIAPEIDDWDASDALDSSTIISDLPLTLHPSPHVILRRIPMTSSITSLNLAYSTLHPDLEKLVAVLPPGLRELGLVGVRFGGNGKSSGPSKKTVIEGHVDEDALKKAFGSLGRKLIVLKVLDLSYPRFNLTSKLLTFLLQPPKSKLPSLRILGLRGHAQEKNNLDVAVEDGQGTPDEEVPDFDTNAVGGVEDAGARTGTGTRGSNGDVSTSCRREHTASEQLHNYTVEAGIVYEDEIRAKKKVLEIVRSGGRRYVHVDW